MSSQPCLAQGDQDAANQRLSTRGSTGRSAANIDQEDASTKISIHFDDQPTGRYRGDRLKKDWPGLQSASSDRSQVVSRTDALRGRDGKCLKVTYPAGKFRSKASGARFKVRLEPREEYSLDYFVRFGHGNGDHWEFRRGGKLPGLAGGKCNTGGHRSTGDGWSVRYMWRDEGRMVAYVYHLDQKKDHADQWPLECTFRPGRWYRLTQRVRVNTDDKPNGILQVWVDGRLVMNRTDLRYRTGSQAPVDHFLFSTFFGGSNATWAPEQESFAYFDEIQIQSKPLFRLPGNTGF